MFVRDYMTTPVTTVKVETNFQDVLKLMREGNFRRAPVVNDQGKLVGIVTEADLMHASPSPATSLSIWELNYLLTKLTVKKVMSTKVITIAPDTLIEDAAKLMVEHKIGGLPVIEKGKIVGIITETDLFRVFSELFGSERAGLRLTLEVPSGRGVLANMAQQIFELGGNIISVGTFPVPDPKLDGLVIKVSGVSKEQLVETLEKLGDHVVDVREV